MASNDTAGDGFDSSGVSATPDAAHPAPSTLDATLARFLDFVFRAQPIVEVAPGFPPPFLE
jgi:hypothetical protein